MEISESTIGTSAAPATEPTSESATPAVRTQGVWKIFQQEAEEVQAVRDVTLTIGSGEFTALAGPSGSGKTTLLNLIGGLTRPTRGQVWVAGHEVSEMSNQELAQLRLEQVGFVFHIGNRHPGRRPGRSGLGFPGFRHRS